MMNKEKPGSNANTKLIAAIPDMVDALRMIIKHQEIVGGSLSRMSTTRQIAKQALDKAGVLKVDD